MPLSEVRSLIICHWFVIEFCRYLAVEGATWMRVVGTPMERGPGLA